MASLNAQPKTNAKIRVLLIPSSDYVGHPFPQRQNQIFELLNNDSSFEVHVVRFAFYDKPVLKTNVILHELSGTYTPNLLMYYMRNSIDHVNQIIKIIRQESIDVIVLSNLSAPLIYTLIDRIAPFHIPIIFDLPDYYPTSAAGYIVNTNSALGRLTVGTLDCSLRFLIKHANAVTVVSNALSNYCTNVGVKNVRYVPNGIGEGFLSTHDPKTMRRNLGFKEEDFVIGYVGTLEFWLDFRKFLSGVSLARKKGANAKILLVGKGLRTDYANKVKDWIDKESLNDAVTWLGFMPHEQVPETMAGLDFGTIPFDVSNPTAYFSSPNKLWEYLSQKTPVLATRIPEMLENKENVCLVSSPEDYAYYILEGISKNEFVSSSMESGYKKSLTKTWKNSAALFAEAIQSVLASEK